MLVSDPVYSIAVLLALVYVKEKAFEGLEVVYVLFTIDLQMIFALMDSQMKWSIDIIIVNPCIVPIINNILDVFDSLS